MSKSNGCLSEIDYLREALHNRDTQIEQLNQLLAMQTQQNHQLIAQLPPLVSERTQKGSIMNAQQRQAKECARLFLKHPDAKKIAKALSLTERIICNIIKRPDFHTELDALGYEGIRKFEHQASKRGKSQKHHKARKMWLAMQTDGTPKHKQAEIISEKLSSPIQTVRGWRVEQ